MEISIKTDFAGQMAKSAILRQVPRAFKANATNWAAVTKRYIMNSYKGGKVFRRPPVEIDQNLDAKVFVTGPQEATIVIGTGGYIGKNPVVYARIQEEGGMTHPLVTAKMRKWAWAMYFKEQGVQRRMLKRDFPNMPSAMRKETARSGASKYLGIALTKKARLDVKLKATHWFTTPIAERRPELDRTMLPDSVWATAQAMSDKGVGG
jgi:hypothetical protein